MNVILINHFLDVDSDTIQHSGGSEGNMIKDNKTIVSLPDVSHRNDDYMMTGGGTRPLTVSNVVKVESKEGMANIINGYRGPKELKDKTLPDL